MVSKGNKIFHQKIVEQFVKNVSFNRESKKQEKKPTPKPVDFSNIPLFSPFISSRPSKKVLSKSKFYGKVIKDQQKLPVKK